MPWPAIPIPSVVELRSLQPTYHTETHNLRRQVRSRGVQRWNVVMTWDTLTRTEAGAIMGTFATLMGRYGTITIPVPGHNKSMAGQTANVTAGSASAGATQISSSGWANGLALRAGDVIKFASHDKVYVVTEDATASGGSATVKFQPPLQAAVSGGTLTYNDVHFKLALANDDMSYATGPVLIVKGMTLEFVEVL